MATGNVAVWCILLVVLTTTAARASSSICEDDCSANQQVGVHYPLCVYLCEIAPQCQYECSEYCQRKYPERVEDCTTQCGGEKKAKILQCCEGCERVEPHNVEACYRKCPTIATVGAAVEGLRQPATGIAI